MPDNERYIDPNSGAAPQPGGAALFVVADEENPDEPIDNWTDPEDARKLSEKQLEDPTGGIEELDDELVFGGTHDTEVQNQAMPLDGDAGPVAPYAAPGVATDDDGNVLGADGEPVSLEEQVEVEGADETVTLDSTNTRIGGDLETGAGQGVDEDGAPIEGDGTEETGTETGTEETGTETEGEQPGGNASKADWTTYAKSKGATDEDLEGKSRDEIKAAYGS